MDTGTKRAIGTMPELSRHFAGAPGSPDEPLANCKHYRVQPGDTLMAIAAREYGSAHDWRRIFEANADTISDPLVLPPGRKIKIPF
jgi:nucleoid-associated protein YgaU